MECQEIYEEDAIAIAECDSILWEQLNNSTILITGATGLIGSTLIRGILRRNELYHSNIKVVALIRNKEKFNKVFEKQRHDSNLSTVYGDICNFELGNTRIDYIIHGASITSSKSFIINPVETILTAINGTNHILEVAVRDNIKGVVYLSSMEVYGKPTEGQILTEDQMGYLDPISVRSSYSESKQMCENLCVSYASEYNVPVKIVRLTQTFGPGVEANDSRVFAEFARCITTQKNIVLLTKGDTKRMYLYTVDAATAILTVLTKGKNGSAYNAANVDSYCTVKEMAEMLVNEFGTEKQKVVINASSDKTRGFNPSQQTYLDTNKISMLGWRCKHGLKDMYERMIACM